MFDNDIDQLMKSDANYDAGKYYTNAFDAVEINNGLYALPIKYGYELLGQNKCNDKLKNWQDFFSTAQKS